MHDMNIERQLLAIDRDIRPSIPGIAIHAPDLLMASPLPSHISMITLALTTSTTTQYLSSHVQFLHLTPHNGEYGEGRHFLSTSYVILYLVFFPLTYRLTDRRIYICVDDIDKVILGDDGESYSLGIVLTRGW